MGVFYNYGPNDDYLGSTRTDTILNAITRPVTFNGVQYDANNPLYKVTVDRARTVIETKGMRLYYSSSNYGWVISGSTNRGLNLLVYAKDATTSVDGYIEKVNDYRGEQNGVFISGKYRTKSALVEKPHYSLACGTVCVNLSVNGKNYTAVMFGSWGEFNFNGSLISFKDVYNNIALQVGYPEVNVIPEYDVITSNQDLSPTYRNVIFDFGTTPQEVPYMFRKWLNDNFEPIYPYTYTVKSQNGELTLSTRVESPAVNAVTVSAVGNRKTLTLTGINGIEYTMTWESETPSGKQFLGLAYDINETRASIPNGQTTPVTWDGNQTLYEVYATYRPPLTTFDINLYQSSAEVNRVDKTDYLTGVGTLSGVLREECSIIAPSITFKQTTVPSFNYVYIAAFGRYYYVTDITSVSKDVWRMSLSCDVLMTWKDDIRALTAIIARQENRFNPLLLDSELPAQANQNITVTEFPAGGFFSALDDNIEHPFLLTVVGA